MNSSSWVELWIGVGAILMNGFVLAFFLGGLRNAVSSLESRMKRIEDIFFYRIRPEIDK